MALIQAVASDQGGSGGSFATTISSTAAGSAIVVGVLCGGGWAGTPGCSDNKSNSYGAAIVSDTNAANVSQCALFVCLNATSGVTSVTITNGGKNIVFVCEESGIVTSGGIDQSGIAPNQSFTTTPTTANVTTTSANEVAYAFACYGNGIPTYTQGTGWTALTGTGITSGQRNNTTAGVAMFMERQVLSSTATIAGAVNSSPGTSGQDSAIVTLIQANQTAITPTVGSVTTSGVAPTVTKALNTVIQTFVARHGGHVLEPDRRIALPKERKIFIPGRKAA